MGLSLQVGTEDSESLEQFVNLNTALMAAGRPAHTEPQNLNDGQIFSCQMWGYSGLHQLRRIAAHLALAKVVPDPNAEKNDDDPVVKSYYKAAMRKRPSGIGKFFSKAHQRLNFQHLMLHSDAEGFYVPQAFQEVIFPDDALKIPGGMIGSSVQLLEECKNLASWLELPLNLDHESDAVWDAADSPTSDGPIWTQYGVDSFSCIRLIRACEASIQTGAAVVFC